MAKNDYLQISSLLELPFKEGVLSYPSDSENVLLYNTSYWLAADQLKSCDVVQNFYPYALEWGNHGFKVSTAIDESKAYDFILCAASKQKEAALFQIANALKHLNKKGLLVVVAANDAGGKRLEKWMGEFGLNVTSLSKSKCRIVWGVKESVNEAVLQKYYEAGLPQEIAINDQNFTTQVGIFGWSKIDQGSKLLTQNLPSELKGVGADFGCGYGFLSKYILGNADKINHMTAIDADFNALECAKKNLEKFDNVDYRWEDLTTSQNIPNNLDFIVMNPPFHVGKKVESDIGQRFIVNAATCLKPKGVLYMVANMHLPYEKTLQENFSNIENLKEENGFKIFKAIK